MFSKKCLHYRRNFNVLLWDTIMFVYGNVFAWVNLAKPAGTFSALHVHVFTRYKTSHYFRCFTKNTWQTTGNVLTLQNQNINMIINSAA